MQEPAMGSAASEGGANEMRDKIPEHPEAKTLWLITYTVPDDDREFRARVSAWSSNYACNLVTAENEGAFITGVAAV